MRDYDQFTREELVAEYVESFIADVHLSLDGQILHEASIPVDMPKSPDYWKSKDRDRHLMHREIARRYHLDYKDVLWLENVGGNDDLYLFDRKLKPIIRDAIRRLEAQEDGLPRQSVKPDYHPDKGTNKTKENRK